MNKKLLLGIAAGGFGVLGAVALTGPSSAASVAPTLVAGNPTCSSLGYDLGFKIEAGDLDGSFDNGVFSVDYDFSISSGTLSFWDADPGVAAVIMKGSNQANVYEYDPAVTADDDLVTPVNASGKNAAISHVTFCVGEATSSS